MDSQRGEEDPTSPNLGVTLHSPHSRHAEMGGPREEPLALLRMFHIKCQLSTGSAVLPLIWRRYYQAWSGSTGSCMNFNYTAHPLRGL